MLFLFLTTAYTLIFSTTFFMVFGFSYLFLEDLVDFLANFQDWFCEDAAQPFCFSEERTVMQAEVFCFFIFAFSKGQTTLLLKLPSEE